MCHQRLQSEVPIQSNPCFGQPARLGIPVFLLFNFLVSTVLFNGLTAQEVDWPLAGYPAL